MNAYATVDLLKSAGVLNITGTANDARLRAALENASRWIDRSCNRHFYALAATRVFDGDGSPALLIPDLAAITSLKTDEDRDRTHEVTWTAGDYFLLPGNADPASSGNPLSRPYTKVEADPNGTRQAFPAGRQTVQITGHWGWWRHLRRATETLGEALDSSETGVDVSARTDIQAGHTLLVDSEQMYVESYAGNTLTVRRGVNGTTAAAHDSGAAIDIYEYPGPVQEAALIQSARLWRRRDSAGIGCGLDADVEAVLGMYRRRGV